MSLKNTEITLNIQPPVEPIKPPPPAAPPAAPPPTPEELAQLAKDTYKSFWGGDAPPEVLRVSQPPPASTPPPPASPAAPSSTPAPAPAPATPPAAEPEPMLLTTEDVIKETAAEAARKAVEGMQPPAAPAPAPAAPQPEKPFELSPEDQADYEVLLYLEGTNPKFAGRAQEFLDYVKKHYAYIEQWEKDHPGQEFNPDDAEHKVWYQENEPQAIDRDTLDSARIDMRVEKKLRAEREPQERAQKAAQAIDAAKDTIIGNINKLVIQMIQGVDPNLAKLVMNADGSANFTEQSIAALEEADATAKAAMDLVLKTQLEPMLLELEKMGVPGSGVTHNPRANPIHGLIETYRAKLENDIRTGPAEQRHRDGKDWLTNAEMLRRQQQIMTGGGTQQQKEASLAELDAKYWAIGIDILENIIVEDSVKKAKIVAEQMDAVARKKYGRGGAVAPAPPPPPPAPAAGLPGKPNPPRLNGQPEVVTNPGVPSGGAKSFSEQATTVMWK